MKFAVIALAFPTALLAQPEGRDYGRSLTITQQGVAATRWTRARAGTVNVGYAAPDFRLPTVDRRSAVQLSSFRGDRPVVLVFGSYT